MFLQGPKDISFTPQSFHITGNLVSDSLTQTGFRKQANLVEPTSLIVFAGYFADHEFLGKIAESIEPDSDGGVSQNCPRLVTVRGRVVIVGYEAHTKAVNKTGVAKLIFLVVTPTDERPADRIEETRAVGARSLIKIAWVLSEYGRRDEFVQ